MQNDHDGKQSNLGPIDPQMGGVPCKGVIDEFEKAKKDIRSNPSSAHLWQMIVGKYHPTFLGTCQHAIDWSDKLAEEWLSRNMCEGNETRARKVLKDFSDQEANKSHARHISMEKCEEIGLSIEHMEEDNELQDLILTAHHAYMHTFAQSTAVKIVENHLGIAYVEHIANVQMGQPFLQMQGPPHSH